MSAGKLVSMSRDPGIGPRSLMVTLPILEQVTEFPMSIYLDALGNDYCAIAATEVAAVQFEVSVH